MTQQRARRRAGDEDRGASATEYAFLVAGIAALIAGMIFLLGPKVADLFHHTCEQMNQVSSQGACQ